MIDIADQLTATYREIARSVADGADQITVADGDTGTATNAAVDVILRRRYSRDIGAVWNAVTEPKHLRRWFGTVTGCHKRDDGFEVAALAGGRVLHREASHLLQFTWQAENPAVVTVRMAPDENTDTIVELVHTTLPGPEGYASGADSAERGPALSTVLAEGTTWDLAFLALQHYLDGSEIEDPTAWRRGLDIQKFAQHSVSAWVRAVETSGAMPAHVPTAPNRDGSGAAPGDGDPVGDAVRECLRRFAPDLTG